MAVEAIVYTSNTGYTAEYARMLGEKTNLSVYTLEAALKQLPAKAEIIYLGWVMGGLIRGLDKARRHFTLCAACGVIMGTTGSQTEQMRKMNTLDGSTPLFSLQGGFDMNRLRGVYRLMMKFMVKKLIADTEAKAEKTKDDEIILGLLRNGGSCVHPDNLRPLIDWYAAQ